ncbi:MAG TPA: NUDIX hydrolase [Geminicoccus sp.]|uniref:NUDIX hydrolase n=1 Tax=Geminicoccus sp. TaxID=2024832 RepID=UPI002E31C2E0|nr:NUDIX hydrolase [Geminicoccus sp.]HEX2525242.1 NUDIX hydrolase [Geminicoccus sp.]
MTDKRDYPPHPIVGVGVVVRRDDKFLLIRRIKPPRVGQWSLPGGRQHLGETVEEAARREVLEESGLTLSSCRLLTVVDLIERDPGERVVWHYTLIDFVAEADHDRVVAGDDAAEAAWFTLDDAVAAVAWEETRRILRMAAEAR